jgi:murein DD-endopeptidase MepM/ murein hydrolase activator NlpD
MMTRHWPVPESYSRIVPRRGTGSFWRARGDRRHGGVDLYAPAGSPVLAIEGGRVLECGVFTTADVNPYWNTTHYVLVRHESGVIAKYAELGQVKVKAGQRIKPGQAVGRVGQVLNPERVGPLSPLYIRQLSRSGRVSMLHFELYEDVAAPTDKYLGGNWFSDRKPPKLLDPTPYLRNVLRLSPPSPRKGASARPRPVPRTRR